MVVFSPPHRRPKSIHLRSENGPESRQGATRFVIIFHMCLADAVLHMFYVFMNENAGVKDNTPLKIGGALDPQTNV